MNFLALCRRVASECGVSTTAPTDTTTQTGRLGQIVQWTADAYQDIVTLHDDWKFMRGSFTVNTTASDGKYAFGDCTDTATSAAIAAFRTWCMDTPVKCFRTADGVGSEFELGYLTYPQWYAEYNLGPQTNGPPNFWAIDKDNGLLLAPKPDGIYTVGGDYMKAATVLAADSDTPVFPADYHLAIVYRAMMKYGRYTGAQEVYTDGRIEYRRVLSEMERTQLPEIEMPGALA